MIIELSYWDMFWIGVVAGWILCWYVPLLLNVQVRSHNNDKTKPNYLKPVDFKYQPTQYFKHVPVAFSYKKPDHSGGTIKEQGNNKNIPERPYCNTDYDYEVGVCLSCLRKFAREEGGKGASHCDECIKSDKVRSNPPPLPEYNPDK